MIHWNKLPPGQGALGLKVSTLKKVCDIKDENDTEDWGDYFTKTGLFQIHNLEVENEYFFY